MKKLLYISFLSILFASCVKSENNQNCDEPTAKAIASEVTALKTYIDSNHISAVEEPRGFYYHIDSVGTGATPGQCSTLVIDYSLKLTTGATVESNNDVQFLLSDLILGWREGLPLIKEGGAITLYLPPSLAYGSRASGPIPANSILIFNIRLKAVK